MFLFVFILFVLSNIKKQIFFGNVFTHLTVKWEDANNIQRKTRPQKVNDTAGVIAVVTKAKQSKETDTLELGTRQIRRDYYCRQKTPNMKNTQTLVWKLIDLI